MPSTHRLALSAALAPLVLLASCGGGSSHDGQDSATGADPAASEPEAATTPPTPAAAAAANTPPEAFGICKACHTVEAGKNGVGPSLFGIVGSKAGDVPGFTFSPALKGSGLVWDRGNLDTWLQGPMKMVPGTRMVVAVPNPEARKAIIDYLETLK